MDTKTHTIGTQPGSGTAEQNSNKKKQGRKPSARTGAERAFGERGSPRHPDNREQFQHPAGQEEMASRTETAVVTQFEFRGCPLRTVAIDGRDVVSLPPMSVRS